MHGYIGNKDCEVEIDSAANISIAAKDLGREPNYTCRYIDIEEVTGETVEAPIAKVLLQLGYRKFWVEAEFSRMPTKMSY